MSREKIVSLAELAGRSQQMKKAGRRVVLCHGTFDLMHAGHIRYLQRSREEGDVLFVTVTADAYVRKGPGRPVFNDQLRAENLAALACVDGVAINHAVTSVDVIHALQPSVYAKGSDYRAHDGDLTGNIVLEQQAVEKHGGRIFYTDEITFSSSHLLNEYFDVFEPETLQFLRDFRARWQFADLQSRLASLRNMRVLVLGDAIVDQYHYVTPLGQTGKGNILAVRFEREEQFAGGAIAVANHIAGFVDHVTLVTGLGKDGQQEAFINSKLHRNIVPEYVRFAQAPTVTKRRFVDQDLSKYFEVYFGVEDPLDADAEQHVADWIERRAGEFDAVVVPDFGNGFITPSIAKLLAGKARHLSVNTQINSGNRGFHAITRYPRADFISLNEPELRLAVHNRHDPIESLVIDVASSLSAQLVAVTRGTRGVVLYEAASKVLEIMPALSTRVVDRIGAGDAFLSLAGICASRKLPVALVGFLGSVAAAMNVQTVCNREPVEPIEFLKYVTTLLK